MIVAPLKELRAPQTLAEEEEAREREEEVLRLSRGLGLALRLLTGVSQLERGMEELWVWAWVQARIIVYCKLIRVRSASG